MKRLLFFCFFISVTSQAQDVFTTYATHAEVSHINLSPQMFQLLSKFKINTSDPESQAFIDMIQTLSRFRVMSTKSKEISTAMENWFKEEINQTALESVLSVTEKGVKIQFATVYDTEKETVDRLVMYVQGLQDYIDKNDSIQLETQTRFDYVLLEVLGEIALDQVAKITQLVDVPGGEYLKALNH